MGLETGDFLDDLVQANPVTATDSVTQGSDHLRLLKKVLQQTFGLMDGLWQLPTNDVWIKQSNFLADGFINLIKANPDDNAEIGANLLIKIGSGTGGSPGGSAEQLVIDKNDNSGISIFSGLTSVGDLRFATSASNAIGVIRYNHSTDLMQIRVNNADGITIAANLNVSIPNGLLGIGGAASDPLHIVNATPAIRLEDTTDSSFSRLRYDFVTFLCDINGVESFRATNTLFTHKTAVKLDDKLTVAGANSEFVGPVFFSDALGNTRFSIDFDGIVKLNNTDNSNVQFQSQGNVAIQYNNALAVTMPGTVTLGTSGTDNVHLLTANGPTSEGGQIDFQGAGAFGNAFIDLNGINFRAIVNTASDAVLDLINLGAGDMGLTCSGDIAAEGDITAFA